MDPILASIDEALARTGMSDAAASKLAAGNYSLIKNMRTARGEEKRYSYQSLEQLARVLGLECYFGPKRSFSGFSEGGSGTDLGKKEALRGGYLPIPWHSSVGKKGSAPVAFSPAWLASNGLIPDFLRAIVPDDSESLGAFEKNTVAVLQTNAAKKGSGAIWCYRDDTKVRIGRVGFIDGAAMVFSDAETAQAVVIPKEAPLGYGLLGKVVWLGHTV